MYQEPSLDHLAALTDDVGLFQHATFDVPNRSCGYCTDDVGRALIVACDAAARPATAETGARLVRTYLAYLQDAQLADGWFHGFMGYDRRWQDARATPDAVGRAIWGLGYAEANAPRAFLAGHRGPAADPRPAGRRHHGTPALAGLRDAGPGPRAGGRAADAFAVREALAKSAELIFQAHHDRRGPGWEWCEDRLTYDNARLPEALLRAAGALGHPPYREAGLAMLEFYAKVTLEGGVFVPVGNAGWFERGGEKSRSGQQPLEAAAMVSAALAAHAQTGEHYWRVVAELAHAWFLGHNTHEAVLAVGGGCCDGLDDGGAQPQHGRRVDLGLRAQRRRHGPRDAGRARAAAAAGPLGPPPRRGRCPHAARCIARYGLFRPLRPPISPRAPERTERRG